MNSRQPLEDYDEFTYLELNPDVEAAVLRGEFVNGRQHWLRHGHGEGRIASPEHLRGSFPPHWNEAKYLRMNPDVDVAVRLGNIESGYAHWCRDGMQEGRAGAAIRTRKADPGEALRNYPRGCNYFGFQGESIGLGAAARGYMRLMENLLGSVDQLGIPWGEADWPSAGAAAARYAVNFLHFNPDVLPAFLRHYSNTAVAGRINIGMWVWEMHAGYPNWHHASRMYHQLWTPSRYCAAALSTVSAAPVMVVPHVVDGLPETPSLSRADLGLPENNFVFLYIFDIASTIQRKNPMALMRAFHAAFANRDDVTLVLKFHHGNYDPAGVQALHTWAAMCPNIRIIDVTMPGADLYSLIQRADCFVSPHRSEGFGLNIATAMYYGKPVIATGYSGNMDYTLPNNSFLVDYDLVELQQDVNYYRKGYAWAEPSTRHLSEMMTLVVNNRNEAARRARRGQRTVRENFSYGASEDTARKCLELLLHPAR